MNVQRILASTSASASSLLRMRGPQKPVSAIYSSGSADGGDWFDEQSSTGMGQLETGWSQVSKQARAMESYVGSLRGYQLPFAFAEPGGPELKWPRSGRL
eukprot:TRINITY_DN555_c0_g1_i12.p1 TRINITY_DN555_c0_g1~~TRINITY_DN555_c0_g1_i12.p1  ORF type:complete len:100 (+),score=4.37 TRINITY_DN555_c0_g1_i12:283-582(+)